MMRKLILMTLLSTSFSFAQTVDQREMLNSQIEQREEKLEYRARNILVGRGNRPHGLFVGVEGYVLFADMITEGDMAIAYDWANQTLSKEQLELLKWKRKFNGTTIDYWDMRRVLLNGKGSIDTEKWSAEKNGLLSATYEYIRTYLDYFSYTSKMKNLVKNNFKAVLTNEELSRLGWDKSERLPPLNDILKTDRHVKKLRETNMIDPKEAMRRGMKK